MFELSWFYLIFFYTILIGVISGVILSLPGIIIVLFQLFYSSNKKIGIIHLLVQFIGLFFILFEFYYNPPTYGEEGMFFLKGMFIESPVKLLMLFFPFTGILISIFYSYIPLIKNYDQIIHDLTPLKNKIESKINIYKEITGVNLIIGIVVFFIFSVLIQTFFNKPDVSTKMFNEKKINKYDLSIKTKRFEILFMTHNDTFIEFNELVSESSERKYQDIDPIKIKRSLDSLSSVIWNQRTQYSTSLINSELNSEYESKLSSNLLESSFILYKLTSQLSFIVGLIGDVKNDPKNFDFNSFVKQVETQSSLFGEYEIKLKELNEYIFQSNNNL